MPAVKTSISLTRELDQALRRLSVAREIEKSRLIENVLRADPAVAAEIRRGQVSPPPWEDPRWTRPGRRDKLKAIAALARTKNDLAIARGDVSFDA